MSRKRTPTTTDLTEQTRQMFENAGKDATPIPVKTQQQAMHELELLDKQMDVKSDWDVQVNAMNRAKGLIQGGILKYESFVKDLIKLSPSLISASRNLRSTLVRASCLLVAQLARELGNKFDVMGEMIIPLSSQTSHGTQIIAESCKFAILQIVSHCHTKKCIRSIVELSSLKSTTNRQISAESMVIIFKKWANNIITKHYDQIAETLTKLIFDSQKETRQFARQASHMLIVQYENKKDSFFSSFDQKIQKQIEDEPITAEAKPVQTQKTAIPVKKKKRAESTKKAETRSKSPVMPPPKFVRNASPTRPAAQTSRSTQAQLRSASLSRDQYLQRNAFTPQAKRTPISNVSIVLVEGNEKEFITQIEEYTNTSRFFSLKNSIDNIVNGLLSCATNDDENVSASSLKLISLLIPHYNTEFLSSLPDIIGVALKRYENCYNALIQSIITQYDPNLVLSITIQQEISGMQLNLISLLCIQPDISLKKPELCSSLLEITKAYVEQDSITVKRIIKEIHGQNNQFLKDQLPNISDQTFSTLINDIIENKNVVSWPIFNPRSVTLWCTEMKEAISKIQDDNWELYRSRVYHDVCNSLSQTQYLNEVFLLMIDILEIKGIKSFEIFLLPTIVYFKNRKAQAASQLFKYLTQNVDTSDFIQQLLNFVDPVDVPVTETVVTQVGKTVIAKGVESQSLLPNISHKLHEIIDCSSIEIRKSVILCFADLYSVFGKKVDHYVKDLNGAQRRLIELYKSKVTRK